MLVQVRWNPAQIGDVNSAALMARLDPKDKFRGWDLYDDNGKTGRRVGERLAEERD